MGRYQCHIARREFSPEEAEEVFQGPIRIRRAAGGRYTALGQTLAGRLAFIVFDRRPHQVIRVIAARDMDRTERRQYRRK